MRPSRILVVLLVAVMLAAGLTVPAAAQAPVDAQAVDKVLGQINDLVKPLAAQKQGLDEKALNNEIRALLYKSLGVMPKWRAADKDLKDITLLLVPKSIGGVYWTDVETGMKAAAQELGVKAIFDGPPQADVNKQISLIEGYIAGGLDGLAIAAQDPDAMGPVIREALDAGIPVVMFDADAPKTDRLLFIGTNNFVAGDLAANKLVEVMGDKGKVMISTGSLSAQNLNERLQAIQDVIKKHPDIKVTSVESYNEDNALGFNLTENVVTANPDLAAIFANGGIDFVVKALQAQGKKPGDVKVVGFNIYDPIPDMIRQGWCQAALNQRPNLMGDLSVRWLVDLIKGKQMPPEGGVIDTGTVMVTKENLDEFLATQH